MKLNAIIREAGLIPATDSFPERYEGVYAGDLLSRAMSSVEAGNLWLTIMNNVNVIAVASLADAAAVVLCENVRLTDEALNAARDKGVCALYSEKSVYALCALIHDLEKSAYEE